MPDTERILIFWRTIFLEILGAQVEKLEKRFVFTTEKNGQTAQTCAASTRLISAQVGLEVVAGRGIHAEGTGLESRGATEKAVT